MKRLIAFPLIFAVFFGMPATMPGHDTGTVQAATVVTIEAPVSGTEVVAQTDDSEANDKDTPWAVVLPLAFAIPLAVLLVPAFLSKRTPGGH